MRHPHTLKLEKQTHIYFEIYKTTLKLRIVLLSYTCKKYMIMIFFKFQNIANYFRLKECLYILCDDKETNRVVSHMIVLG